MIPYNFVNIISLDVLSKVAFFQKNIMFQKICIMLLVENFFVFFKGFWGNSDEMSENSESHFILGKICIFFAIFSTLIFTFFSLNILHFLEYQTTHVHSHNKHPLVCQTSWKLWNFVFIYFDMTFDMLWKWGIERVMQRV